MAPLNSEEGENSHVASIEDFAKRRPSWLSLFFNSYIHQRKTSNVLNAKEAPVDNQVTAKTVENIGNDLLDNSHVSLEELPKRRYSWFSLFFNWYIHQRKKSDTLNAQHESVGNHDRTKCVGNVEHVDAGTDISIEKNTNLNAVKEVEKNLVCDKCKIEQDNVIENKQSTFRKEPPNVHISTKGIVYSRLMNFSPQWFKSLMRDPEFVMVGGEKAKHNE